MLLHIGARLLISKEGDKAVSTTFWKDEKALDRNISQNPKYAEVKRARFINPCMH